MTNEELFEDLKQFIEASFSQRMADVATKDDIIRLDNKFEARLDVMDYKLDAIQDAVGEALTISNETTSEQMKDHDTRIRRLEKAKVR